MKRGLFITAFVMFIAMSFGQNVQVVTLPKYYANSIYSFTRMINWPNSTGGDFSIAVIGNKDVYQELLGVTSGKTVGAQPIKVKFFKKIDEMDDNNQIVFMAGTMGIPIKKLTQKTEGQKSLIITECQGMLEWGSSINFVESDGFMKFEMSKTAMLSKGFQISSQLEKMALHVI